MESPLTLLHVSEQAFLDENEAVRHLLAHVHVYDAHADAISARAHRYVTALRADHSFNYLEAFYAEFSLQSHEGIMMMCLAEALLRIPDKATADALIHDKLASGEWDKHIGSGRSLLLSAGSLGLELGGRIADMQGLTQTAGEFVGGLIHRIGEPLVRAALKQAMKLMGKAFVLGATIQQALSHAESLRDGRTLFSFDMLGEGARSAAQAQAHWQSYHTAIEALAEQKAEGLYARDGISVKLTALHPRVELRKWQQLKEELMPKLKSLAAAAMRAQVTLTIDAEEATRFDVTLLAFETVLRDPDFAGYQGLGLAVQAYQKRAPALIAYLEMLAQETGRRIPVRLVKGAYWDGEIKRAQIDGLVQYPVFTCKRHTDLSYLACARLLLARPECFYPQFATHNARTIASILETAADGEYEFQRLYGMGEGIYRIVTAETGRMCRIYAPVGAPQQLLSYLIRRILENAANNSFVRGLKDAPLETLLADPIALSRDSSAQALPIALPYHLYPDRANSRGYDLGNESHLRRLTLTITRDVVSPPPANTDRALIGAAGSRAQIAFASWSQLAMQDRAACLERIAERYAVHESELISLCMHEGGKTLADAVGEWCEAIDYCRYYAAQARMLAQSQTLAGPSGEHNLLRLLPRGVVVAISPWNFPLAIFTGQVAAALVTGNCVLAKPSEETPRIAQLAVQLMHAADVPRGTLQLIVGGSEIGEVLISHPIVRTVVFTGSLDTAQRIARVLADKPGPLVPFIAETGGQNCMVVDSSALLEQTVDDIIVSAFGSAGQRCSALRVVFVQEEIAEDLCTLLAGAMNALTLGDPLSLATDIGPVISRNAYDDLSAHIDHMRRHARLIGHAPLPADSKERLLIAPHAFEIRTIDELQREVFGPVLHVIRYRAGTLAEVAEQINSTGYGLTFGIQSRIDATIHFLSERVRAGNIYVNRSMIGAVVGVQPFGGQGLSGTGPKAGGPHYLARFCTEQTISINTAAIGGNIELLMK